MVIKSGKKDKLVEKIKLERIERTPRLKRKKLNYVPDDYINNLTLYGPEDVYMVIFI